MDTTPVEPEQKLPPRPASTMASLVELPLELRENIWRHFMANIPPTDRIYLRTNGNFSYRELPYNKQFAPLLQLRYVCRQMRDEIPDMAFANTKVHILPDASVSSNTRAQMPLQNMGRPFSQISQAVIHTLYRERKTLRLSDMLPLLGTMTRLRTVILDFERLSGSAVAGFNGGQFLPLATHSIAYLNSEEGGRVLHQLAWFMTLQHCRTVLLEEDGEKESLTAANLPPWQAFLANRSPSVEPVELFFKCYLATETADVDLLVNLTTDVVVQRDVRPRKRWLPHPAYDQNGVSSTSSLAGSDDYQRTVLQEPMPRWDADISSLSSTKQADVLRF